MVKTELKLIMAGIVVALFVVEVGLRIIGFGYKVTHARNETIEAQYRIFCLGESTTWGIGAKDPLTQSYPKQLERMLNEKFNDFKIQVFYDLTIGQNSSEILDKLPSYIGKYQPQLIIIMCGANNWWNLNKSNILLFNKNKFAPNINLRILMTLDNFRVWKLFKWVSLSFNFYSQRWNYYFPAGETPNTLWAKVAESVADTGIFEEIMEHDIIEMVKICRSNNIDVILCSYPRYRHFRVHFSKIASDFGIIFVDNYAVFDKLFDLKGYLSEEGMDGLHPNEKGYKIVAENIYRAIVEKGLIKK